MQADSQQVDADVANSDHHKPNNGNKRRATSLPAATQAGVQIGRVNQPADQSPGLLGIPTPVTSPGFIGPNRTTHDADGEHQKTNRDRAIAQAVDLFSGAQLHRLQGNRTTIRSRGGLPKSTTADGTAAQLQSLAAIRNQHRQ